MIFLSILIYLLFTIHWMFGMGCALSEDYMDDNNYEPHYYGYHRGGASLMVRDHNSDHILSAHARNNLLNLEYDNRRRNHIILNYDIEAQSALNREREKHKRVYDKHSKLYKRKCSLYRFIFT